MLASTFGIVKNICSPLLFAHLEMPLLVAHSNHHNGYMGHGTCRSKQCTWRVIGGDLAGPWRGMAGIQTIDISRQNPAKTSKSYGIFDARDILH